MKYLVSGGIQHATEGDTSDSDIRDVTCRAHMSINSYNRYKK